MSHRLAWPLATRATLLLGIGLLLGFAAPFSAHPPPTVLVRYSFWVGMVFVGYAAALAAHKLIPKSSIGHPELRLAAVAIASAVPLTFVAAWAIALIRPGHIYTPLRLPALFGPVAVVQLVITFTTLGKFGVTASSPAAGTRDRSHPFPPTLLSRLPDRLGDEIVALEAEDHYIRVHTRLGSDLVLMRLSDAIGAMQPELGMQVHRSWWVAHQAICDIVRSERRVQLKMMTGLMVPVGRTYTAAVRSRTARMLQR